MLAGTLLTMPKTTIDLPEKLLAQAKGRAAEQRTSLREVVVTALREHLNATASSEPFSLRDASVDGRGLHQEFKGRSFDSVLDAAYEGRGA